MSRTKKCSTKKLLQKQSQKVDRDNGQSSEQNAPQASIRKRKAPLAAGSTSTLERMPLEIRRDILKYILLNPELGTASCIHRDEGWGSKIKYELQPAILRVCKQLHAEGVGILYGENRFFIECALSSWGHSLSRCALTRFYDFESCEGFPSSNKLAINRLKAVPGVKRIRHWKLLIAPMRHGARKNVMNFCRSIRHNRIKSMEIAIAPWDSNFGIPRARAGINGVTAGSIEDIFSPLEILRCTGKVIIRGADPEELPDFLFKGDSRSYDFYNYGLGKKNPFHGTHLVESALLKALRMQMNEEAGAQDISELKILRSNAIKFLERQYQRVQHAANDLVRFVKDQKVSGGLLDPAQSTPFESSPGAQSEGLVLLKIYAESLDRELTTTTKIAICRLNGQYEKRFELLPREIAIKKCTNAYRVGDVEKFVANFKRAVDDMDTQYLAIRNARKRLFEWI
ncbi:hypothetical protein BCON_0452g00030 [Botryotinia convoluta]|uniref:F-box domain-containing protein n=1 Tax=Botryotinia convoluta TaxID=54673 RepID=A0A4Z1H9J7_9HELO|nr:hypothetical protein BCON_0452g00030 [Botryotinia convoluta]